MGPFETEERRAFRETLRAFVAKEVTPFASEWDEAGEVPWALHEKVGALGAFGLGIDEAYGGLGFDDVFMRCAYAEELARCGAGGVSAALGGRLISMGPVHDLGTEEVKARALPEVVAGRKGSSLAITEPSGGSDVAALRTSARKDGNHWVIDGEKTFITGGLKADWVTVAARTGGAGIGGVSLFLVEADREGFSRVSVGEKTGWWCSDTAMLRFDGVRVPAENLLGREGEGFVAAMRNFNLERLNMTAQCVGTMKCCLDYAVDWARGRETFGAPLITRQAIRHKAVEMQSRIEALEAWVERICWKLEAGDDAAGEIARAKAFGTKALEFCASECFQILGGAGFLRGNPVERTWREVKVMAIGGGSEEVMRDLAARRMGL
ncbi:MAG: acyl-CoA dehydrogenase family protein [Paracoccaceae bacterium]